MRSGLLACVVAGSLTMMAADAASAPIAQPLQPAAAGDPLPQKEPRAARPLSAVLRYGAATLSACKDLSDNSSAICLLLALHVMQLSQKQVSETKL